MDLHNKTTRVMLATYGKAKLYHYHDSTSACGPDLPLLIVYALVNSAEILDITPERSFINKLKQEGVRVYLIEWQEVSEADQALGLEDYILNFLARAVQKVTKHANTKQINMLGVCQGGLFASCYTALNQAEINKLVLTVTPINYHHQDNLIYQRMKYLNIDSLVAHFGNIPASFVSQFFLSMKPHAYLLKKYLDIALEPPSDIERIFFDQMEQWLYQGPNLAGKTFREFSKEIIQNNALYIDKFYLAGKHVELKKITCHVLNIYATDDHIAPAASVQAFREKLPNAHYHEMVYQGGHVGLFVSNKRGNKFVLKIINFLNGQGLY